MSARGNSWNKTFDNIGQLIFSFLQCWARDGCSNIKYLRKEFHHETISFFSSLLASNLSRSRTKRKWISKTVKCSNDTLLYITGRNCEITKKSHEAAREETFHGKLHGGNYFNYSRDCTRRCLRVQRPSLWAEEFLKGYAAAARLLSTGSSFPSIWSLSLYHWQSSSRRSQSRVIKRRSVASCRNWLMVHFKIFIIASETLRRIDEWLWFPYPRLRVSGLAKKKNCWIICTIAEI